MGRDSIISGPRRRNAGRLKPLGAFNPKASAFELKRLDSADKIRKYNLAVKQSGRLVNSRPFGGNVMSVLIVIAEIYGTSFAYVCVRDQAIHAPDCLSIPLTVVGSTLFDLVFQAGH